MSSRTRIAALFVASAFVVTGCGTMTANNKEMKNARLHLGTGDLNAALAAQKNRKDLCGILDRAVLYQLQGNPVASNQEFDQALAQIKTYEDRAVISATEVGKGAGSVLLNDKVLEYQGEGFEKVMIHTLKARNYLMLGDEEAARVEIRNANMRQDEERKRNEEAIEAAKAEQASHNLTFDDQINTAFASSQEVLSRLDNVYQNPFATYLSGVVYELNGELDDAFLDYKLAYEMVPNPVIGSDLARLGGKLRRGDEVEALGLHADSKAGAGGNTLVLLDNGLSPERVEMKIPIPAGNTVAAAALPVSQPIPTNLSEVAILDAEGNELGRTAMMVDIEAMSVRNLRDHYPAILTRQAIRLAAKIAASNAAVAAARQQDATAGLVVQLFTSVANVVTEQADLRGWYQLPRSVHVGRLTLPPDTHEVTVRLLDLGGNPIGDLKVPVIEADDHLKIVGLRYVNGQTIALRPAVPATPQMAGGDAAPAQLAARSEAGR